MELSAENPPFYMACAACGANREISEGAYRTYEGLPQSQICEECGALAVGFLKKSVPLALDIEQRFQNLNVAVNELWAAINRLKDRRDYYGPKRRTNKRVR